MGMLEREDEILERDRFCIFCRREKVRTRWVPSKWRHIDTGLIVCDVAFQQGRWTAKGPIAG
jgi:hypothetical protein